MGILTDMVIARPDEAAAIAASINPADTWPTLSLKGVDTIKLIELYCALSAVPYHDDLHNLFSEACPAGPDGPWVFRYPPQLLDALTGLRVERIPAVARAWLQSEELQMDRWTQVDAQEVITQLIDHAKSVRTPEQTLFLWLCL